MSFPCSRSVSLVPIAAALLAVSQAGAADPPPERLESPETELVVVTATRTEQPAGRVASTITVVTEEEIRRKQHRFVVDALREVPGVDVRQNGGPGTTVSVFLRGADSDHTLVLLDGVELNDPASPSRVPILGLLTTDGVERIEVLRGPQSTLYGADALGGVIQIFTRAGGGPASARLSAEAGSFGTLRARLGGSGGGERLSWSVDASGTDLDGFSATRDGVEDDAYENLTGAARLGWDDGDRFGFDLTARFVDDRVEFDGFSGEEDHWIDGRLEVFRVQPRLRLLEGRWRQRFGLQVARHERDTTSSSPSLVRGELRALNWQNDVSLRGGHTLSVGAEVQDERARFAAFEAEATTVGAYAQDALRFGAGGFATLGVRLDDHERYGAEPTYRVTAGNEFRGGTTLRFSAGTGLKAPSLSQLDPTSFAGNPELDPERSRGYEVGVDQSGRDGTLVGGITLFRSRIEDLILAVFDPGSGGFLNLNVDRARAQGVEAYLRFDPIAAFGLTTSYTYTETEALGVPFGFGLEPGSPLLRRPRHKGSLDLHAHLRGGNVGLTLGAIHVGSRVDLDPVTFSVVQADAHTTLRVAASWRVAGPVTLEARLENFLDEEYDDVLGFTSPGRSGYVGLGLDLGAGAAGGRP